MVTMATYVKCARRRYRFVVVVVVVGDGGGGGGGCYRGPASHRYGYTGRWHATIHNAKQGRQKERKKKESVGEKKQQIKINLKNKRREADYNHKSGNSHGKSVCWFSQRS